MRQVTRGSRGDAFNPADCGGRIGPYNGRDALAAARLLPPGTRFTALGEMAPDLRNLEVFVHKLRHNDTVLVMSDGVYDNLDAHSQGLSPVALGLDLPPTAQGRKLKVRRRRLLSFSLSRADEGEQDEWEAVSKSDPVAADAALTLYRQVCTSSTAREQD